MVVAEGMMAQTVVMKFGGTSVGSSERIGGVAKRVAKHRKETGDRVVVVVSAMSGETDRLIELARKVGGDRYPVREYNQLVTSGEHASVALTAIALEREGVPARSLLANQVQIRTRGAYGQNLISGVETETLEELLERGITPVVAGFQGIDEFGDFTTLGRGGSDTTAVAIAAALGPCRCDILTDIDGVYTALPSICKRARKLQTLTYEEMLEMASSGAKVLQARSVSLAYKFKVPLVVCSSFSEIEGTLIVEEYQGMADAVVSGITCRADEAKLTLRNVPDKPGIAAKVFKVLGDAEVVVDMIVQSQGTAGRAAISFTVPQESAQTAYEALLKLATEEMPDASVELDKDIAKLSVVGEGMRTHAGVASKMFEVLGANGINVEMITTSEIKISVAIEAKYSELAVRVLHECFIEQQDAGR
ncbi:MAG: aspartate kinase [Bdellovibrionales bacterium]|nr:aspartate kinase [Bdellovibrionales bacterium]